jgi:hypothetical protein
MARHEVIIHENTSATKEVAPYLGNYISKETLETEAFASAIGAKCGLPAIQVIAILDGSFQALEELEGEGLVRVHTDVGTICAVIKGSFPTADAPFDPERNSLELALRLDDSIQLCLADTVPSIVTDMNVTKLRVDNVMDLVEERPMNLIHGRHVFRVAGFNMALADEGAATYLEDARGTTFALVVDEVVSKQLFKAHTAELLPGGDYKLVVKSRAGDAGGPLQTSFRKVKYLRVVDPVPLAQTSDGKCKVMSFKDGDSATDFTYGHDWALEGSGLYGDGAPEGEWAFDYATFHVGAEDLTFRGEFEHDGSSATLTPLPDQHITPGTYENVAFNCNVVRDGETETLTLTIPHLTVT